MVRKQVYLSPHQNERLRRAASRQRRTEAEVLRDALDRFLDEGRTSRIDVDHDPLWQLVGVAASHDGTLSERVDEVLYGRARR